MKKKKFVKRILAFSSTILILFLMLAPISSSAAGIVLTRFGAYDYWTRFTPSFSESSDINWGFMEVDKSPFQNVVNPIFDRNIPTSLRDEFIGQYESQGIYLYGTDYDSSFNMYLYFSIRLEKPLELVSGERLIFYYITTENSFTTSDGQLVHYNRPSNCRLAYYDENNHLVQYPEDTVYATIESEKNDRDLWVTRVEIENLSQTILNGNSFIFSYTASDMPTSYTGVTRFGMVLSPVLRLVADPDIFPDIDEIGNILLQNGQLQRETLEKIDGLSDQLTQYFTIEEPAYIPDWSQNNSNVVDQSGAIDGYNSQIDLFSVIFALDDYKSCAKLFCGSWINYWFVPNGAFYMSIIAGTFLITRALVGR